MKKSILQFVVLGLLTAGSAVAHPALGAAILPYITLGLGLATLWAGASCLHRALAGRFIRKSSPGRPAIIVDGSNVMHWQADVPSLKTLMLVLNDLTARGFAPQVYFDANVGYKLFNRPMDTRDLAQQLALAPGQITLAPSRTPADPLLIAHAIDAGVPVVSNDRFMDWREAFPQIRGKGFLVPGRVMGGRVELRFATAAA
jgi:hypothetical protein